jgi:hypothetical protein
MRFPPNVELLQETQPFNRVIVLVDGNPVLNGKTGDIDYIKPEHIMTKHDSKTLIERIMWAVSEKPKKTIHCVEN